MPSVKAGNRQRYLLYSLAWLAAMLLLAWLSTRTAWFADLTDNRYNSLSQQSRDVLSRLQGPLTIQAWIRKTRADKSATGNRYSARRERIEHIIKRYRQFHKDISIEFMNPDDHPEQARRLKISAAGDILISYQGRTEKIQIFNELHITNALMRLLKPSNQWIAFLEGHGERNIFNKDGHGYSNLVLRLKQRGINSLALNLARTPVIPDNTGVLVIASPERPLTSEETSLIRNHVLRGGNLLWLHDPDSSRIPELEKLLGIQFLPGTVLTPPGPSTRSPNPAITVISQYAKKQPLTSGLDSSTVFPLAAAIISYHDKPWKPTSFLKTETTSWNETGDLSRPPFRFDPHSAERTGPLHIGMVLTRPLDKRRVQRIVIIGDSDFLGNASIRNPGNMQLGLAMLHWLGNDKRFITIKRKPVGDLELKLDDSTIFMLTFLYPLILPALLLLTGFVVSTRRKRR